MAERKPPSFPFAGIICMLMGGMLLMSGGFWFGKYMVGFGVAWAALALFLIKRP